MRYAVEPLSKYNEIGYVKGFSCIAITENTLLSKGIHPAASYQERKSWHVVFADVSHRGVAARDEKAI